MIRAEDGSGPIQVGTVTSAVPQKKMETRMGIGEIVVVVLCLAVVVGGIWLLVSRNKKSRG